MRIKSVQIEGMHQVIDETYELSDVTYFVGPNGSGKSTILQAIVLCLLGYIPGTSKKVGDIFKHANSNRMCITLILQDAEQTVTLIREFINVGGKITNELTLTPSDYDLNKIVNDISLPMLNFNEFLGLSANKQKELLISLLPNSINSINTLEYLKEDPLYTDELEDFVAELASYGDSLDSVDSIKKFNETLKEQQTVLSAEEKRITATTQSLIFYDDYSGEEDVNVLQEQIADLLKQRDNVLKREAKEETMLQQKTQLAQLESELSLSIETDQTAENINREMDKLAENIAMTEESIKIILQEKDDLRYKHQQNSKVIQSKGICPYIEDNCERIWDLLPSFQKENEQVENRFDVIEKEQKLAEDTSRQYTHRFQELKEQLAELKDKYKRRDNLRNLLVDSIDIVDEHNEETSEELSAKLQELNDDLVKSSANAKYQQIVDVVEKQKLQLLPQITFIKSAIKRTGPNGLQSEVAKRPFKDMELAMYSIQKQFGLENLGIPEFNLEEKANSFAFGFMRSKFISFDLLSSGEKCIFTLLFMAALCECSNSELKCVIIDDLLDHLDEEKFQTIINNVSDEIESLQFVFAGVKPTQQQGVRVVDLGKIND